MTEGVGAVMIENILYQASIWILPLTLAITLHEAAHAYVAWMLGDPTARSLGRVTLNPFRHIDLFGTVAMPLLCLLSSLGMVFGFAKPVPVDFRRLGNPRRAMILIAIAGPLANIVLLLVSALLFHVSILLPDFVGDWTHENLKRSMFINAILAVFNMLPVPPLDGGRIVTGLLPYRSALVYARLERYGLLIVIGVFLILPTILTSLAYDPSLLNNILSVPIFGLIEFALWATGSS